MKIDIDHMLSLSKMRSDYLEKIDKLRNRRNEIASQMKSKLEASIREKLVLEGQSLKTQISDSEEQYVYPCYAYDDGLCAEVTKYNLDYD